MKPRKYTNPPAMYLRASLTRARSAVQLDKDGLADAKAAHEGTNHRDAAAEAKATRAVQRAQAKLAKAEQRLEAITQEVEVANVSFRDGDADVAELRF